MPELPAELRSLIESAPLAHLSTVDADGSPYVNVIWIGLDGEDIVSGHRTRKRIVRNMERDPRVTLSCTGPRDQNAFLNPYAVLRCTATVTPSDETWDLLDRLTKLYMGPGTDFPGGKGPGWITRYRVERITGVGPWVAN